MDLSALIFVALAVAWAVYLIPKALKHHDEVQRSRSVDKFSHTMRVLARREPVDRRNARLVVSPVRAVLRPPVETKARTTVVQPETQDETPQDGALVEVPVEVTVSRPVSPQAARAAARRAAKRRRNVLALVVLVNAVVIGLAVGSVVAWGWVAAPAALLGAWLVACRVSVTAERRVRAPRSAIEIGFPPEVEIGNDPDITGEIAPVPPTPRQSQVPSPQESPAGEVPAVLTGEIAIITESIAGGWDMVPTTLPTYVTKPAARRRTVATIDLDSTGVWSSGRSDEDSALARSADESARSAREADESRRASGA